MTSITFINVEKVYPSGINAVKDFNLKIKEGEFLVLVGPSGCGKTTVLRLIAGLESVTGGEIYFDEKLMNAIESKDRDVAMVFQNYALYPHMSVYENMAFGLKLRRTNKKVINERVINAAEILGLTEYLERRPKSLSGGQRQRVALGRAIVREPRVFLLDEPLSNLDAKMRNQMRTEINMLHKQLGTTFVYVTHDQVEAMTMGTRIVVMKDGCIQQVDDAYHLYEYPANKFVAEFIGTPQMNFIDTTITSEGGEKFLCFGNYRIKLTAALLRMIKPEAYLNKSLILGLRPEDIKTDVDFIKSNPRQALRAKINLAEELGYETLLHLSVTSLPNRIIVRTRERKLWARGSIIDLAIDVDRAKLFDQETGESLLNQEAAERRRLS